MKLVSDRTTKDEEKNEVSSDTVLITSDDITKMGLVEVGVGVVIKVLTDIVSISDEGIGIKRDTDAVCVMTGIDEKKVRVGVDCVNISVAVAIGVVTVTIGEGERNVVIRETPVLASVEVEMTFVATNNAPVLAAVEVGIMLATVKVGMMLATVEVEMLLATVEVLVITDNCTSTCYRRGWNDA